MVDIRQRVPDVRQVEQTAAHSDPMIRNLQITQCYHELSAALSERTGLSANLFEPPFTPDQVTALQADLLPVGTL